MKSYEDIAERVFIKGDAILEKKHRQIAIIKRTSLAFSGICAVVLVGLGIWKNNDIRNAINDNQEIIMDNLIIKETDTEIPIQTSVTESISHNAVLPGKISTTAVHENTAVLSQTTVSNYRHTADIIIPDATITEYTSVIQEKDTETEPLQEMIQTTVSTTIQTNLIVTETTVPPQNIDDERSLYMKKFTSFVSAITLAAAAIPTTGNAVYNIDQSRYWPGENEIFSAMESGEFNTDINGNGKFDIMDCYLLECYVLENRSPMLYANTDIDAEIISRIESVADYNKNGKIDDEDSDHLMRYFIVNGGLQAKYLDANYYDNEVPTASSPDMYEYSNTAYRFSYRLSCNMDYLNAGYYVVAEMCDNGIMNLDFNGNGQLDVGDIFDIYLYENTHWHAFNEQFDRPSSGVARSYLTDDEWERCDKAYSNYPYFFMNGYEMCSEFVDSVTLYIAGHIELKPEYFTEEYYIEAIDNYVKSYALSYRLKDAVVALGLKEDEYACTKFNLDEFEPFFDAYCKDIENGLRPAPDINMDGVVDYIDYFDANIYYSDLLNFRSADESILPEETWNNLSENCDFNGDGVSSDIYDITAIQLYIVKYVDEPDNFDEAYNEYKNTLSVSSENVFEPFSYEKNVEILLGLDIERFGDANEDGKTGMADAVLIMQALSNPNEYKLTTKGQFNADVCNTGDGITPADALQIQTWSMQAK